MGRPRTGETPRRFVRVPDGVWDAARARAESEGRTISKVINDYLIKYGKPRRIGT